MSEHRPVRRIARAALVLLLGSLGATSGSAAPGQNPATKPADPAQQKDDRDRIKIPGWQFVNIFAGVTDARGVDEAAAARTIKDQVKAAGDGKNLRAVADLFQKHPFAVVEKVAKNKGLTPVEADGLSRMRRQMINEAMAKAIAEIDPGKTLTIGMLDSGNKNSGIASDVDQTVFVMPKDKAQQLKIDETKVIDAFNKKFHELYGVHPERLGIESLNGADFFPDWRQAHSIDEIGSGASDLGKEASTLMKEGDRVVNEKRKNPEAYRSEGQLKSQAEGRGYEALQEHSQRIRDLDEARDKIEEIQKSATLSDAEKRARAAEVEASVLKKHQKNYPAGSLADLEKAFNKDSPWTEVGWDESGKVSTSQLEDPAGKVLANKPEFHDRFAFDGAWDNWIMYEHHPANRRKYLLRSIAEGISLRRQRTGALSTFEYEKVYSKNTAESRQELKRFVDDVYRDLPDATRELFRKAMDVAAKERLRHKGVKNPSTGQDYSLKEVFSEFWPAVSAEERAMYRDMPNEAFDKMLAERALRQWESVGREVMIENLVRTIESPASLLQTPMSDAEFAKIKEQFPDATRAKLNKVVERQLYHGLHDLMTIEHAQELVASPDLKKTLPPRQTDLVDRLLEKLGGERSELGQLVRKIAYAAAAKRVASDPGGRTFRQEVYSYLRDSLTEMLAEKVEAVADVYEHASQFYEDYKAGKVTSEHIVRNLTIAAAERVTSAKLQALHLLGFNVRDAALLIPEHGWPSVEIEYGTEKWSAGRLMEHVATAGNVDSALTVLLAYKEGGASAAAWAAGFEIMMNFPPFAHANVLKELVVDHRPQGAIMMGSAMVIPVLGEAYILINIAKTSVTLLGHYILDPLHDDDADKMYQGFLDARSGFRFIERSQRPSLLHFVPIRAIPTTVDGPDGKRVPTLVWQRYSAAEAEQRFNVYDAKEYGKLVQAGILGGGPEWDAAFADVRDEIANPAGAFEARRASMYYLFGDPIKALLAPANADPDDTEAMPIIAKFFLGYVDEWVSAKGTFAGFDENVTISRRFEEPALRQRIASRAARDFVYSYKLVHGSVIDEGTIEHNIKARIEQFRLEQAAGEANAMAVGLDEAWRLNPDMNLAHAIDQELEKRKDEARERSPRFHAWPRLVSTSTSPADRLDDQRIEFVVSILDGPAKGELTPANKAYKTSVRYQLEVIDRDELEVTAFVQVVGAQTGEKIPPFVPKDFDNMSATPQQELAVVLGRIARPGSMPERTDLKVAYRLKDAAAQKRAADGAAATTSAIKPGDKPPKGQTTTNDAGLLFDDITSQKAAPRSDTWAGQPVAFFAGQAWICWEKAPLDQFYYYEIQVTGGSSKYDHANRSVIGAIDKFPDGKESSGRANVFILPFDWPEGNVGSFALKGTVYAFDAPVTDADWKSKTPVSRFEFTQPFAIADARVAAPAELMLKYTQQMTASEVGATNLPAGEKERYARYAGTNGTTGVDVYERLDSSKSDLWMKNWIGLDEKKAGGVSFRMRVRWKDVPPNATYFYEITTRGGAPAFEETRAAEITPRDDFAPAPYKSGPGSSAFEIDVPSPIFRGGSFDVTGTLYAVPKQSYTSTSWKQAKPLATCPFREGFELHNRSRFFKGTARVSDDGLVQLMILMAYVQRGKRPVKIDAGGKTTYALLDDDYYGGGYFPGHPSSSHWAVVNMPFGTSAPTSATITFMDFGESITATVPLDPEGPPPNPARRQAAVDASDRQSLAHIQDLMKNEEANVDPLAREYSDLAQHARPTDYAKWKQYAQASADYWDRKWRPQLTRARTDAEREQLQGIIATNVEQLYWGAVEWGNLGEATSQLAACAGRLQGSGLPAPETNGRLAHLYVQHADNLMKLTGDVTQAAAAWNKAHDFGKASVGGRLWEWRDGDKNPYEGIDPSFRVVR